MLMLASPMIGMCFSSVTNVSLSASNPAHSRSERNRSEYNPLLMVWE
ncbi:hypothetical protein HanIR_Chr02g0094201 [Helianthus annuus]|nr:hypothetical protein HanIR_Chr02g0094201 [Helianthus annuus]